MTLPRFNDSDNKYQRSNDGTADPHEFFWTDSMTDVGLGGFQSEDKPIPLACTKSFYTHSKAGEIHVHMYLTTPYGVHTILSWPDRPWQSLDSIHSNLPVLCYSESRLTKISPARRITGQVSLPTRSLACVQSAGTEPVITSAADEDGEGQSKRCGDISFKADVGKGGLELVNFKMRYEGTASVRTTK
ncbi:hypothetical protein E4U33_001088 [Claviceps sp. LM78 group G4]|nr:hypothetical protein E4U33_001088 [Claviceps sp. LM78 group G4]